MRAIAEPGALADTSGYAPDLTFEQKVELLETVDVIERLELALRLQRERLAELQVRKRIRDDVEDDAQRQQREYVLRKQMESIRKELGDDDASVVEEYRTKIDEADMPEAVREQAERELSPARADGRRERRGLDDPLVPRLARRGAVVEALGRAPGSRARARGPRHRPRRPRGRQGPHRRVPGRAQAAQERGIEPDKKSGAILTLVGPPGTGKTSIGESVARALGREFVRMSLGGIRDEAEIRGHRRTYIGALPGRLVRALRDAGTMNPVIMLDEVDKVGADWRGDPSAALLEVLDPAQNHSFRDHYLDVELDLSEVFFIATGNIARDDPRPAARPDGGHPLRRLHRRREGRDRARLPLAAAARAERPARGRGRGRRRGALDDRDRVHARGRRPPARARARQGAAQDRDADRLGQVEPPVVVDLDVVRDALGRQKFFQEAAERTAIPGVATGLAVTGTGGDVLFVEATAMAGERDGLVLTGQLGDVMKESARIALSYVRAHADELGIDESAFEDRSFHVHVPAGAIPKDGPSAGITMTTALASLLSGRPGAAHGRDDRRGHAPGPRAADRRAQAEGARRARGRADRRDPARAEPRRPRRRPRGRARGDDASTR